MVHSGSVTILDDKSVPADAHAYVVAIGRCLLHWFIQVDSLQFYSVKLLINFQTPHVMKRVIRAQLLRMPVEFIHSKWRNLWSTLLFQKKKNMKNMCLPLIMSFPHSLITAEKMWHNFLCSIMMKWIPYHFKFRHL